MAKVCVFLADGFEEIEGLTVVDLLRRAKQEVVMVSITKKLEITGSHNIRIQADVLFEDMNYEEVDMLVLPGGMPGTKYLGEHQGLMELVNTFYTEGKWVSAICAAPSLLGKLGILDGKEAVCYPGFEGELRGASISQKKVVTDGKVITSRGMGCAIAFSLEIIEQLVNKQVAQELKEAIIYGHSL